MANASHEARASSRRQRPRSRSPPRTESVRRQHHSRSPTRHYESPPDCRERRTQDNGRQVKNEVFQSSAGSHGGVCAVCLGRHDHMFTKCNNAKQWNGAPCTAQKNEQGRLVAANGLPLCFDWQVPRGCMSTSHPDQHVCSGCRLADHRAQGCP